jgi:excisionase family DNA binding protein
MTNSFLTAGEAAQRLGVSPITIQRWVDAGELRAGRTAGGHRRIPMSEVRKRLTAFRSPAEARRLAFWLAGLLSGRVAPVARLMTTARSSSASWAGVADDVARVVVELGDLWQAGDCSVFEEHMATESLRRAAAACAAAIPRRRDAPTALLTTAPGERHTLGLSLAELVLAERGWRSVWIGEGPPAPEFPAMLDRLAPDLCVVSASAGVEPRALQGLQRRLVRSVSAAGSRLVLAGGGRWRAWASAYRCRTFEDFDRCLVSLASPRRRG